MSQENVAMFSKAVHAYNRGDIEGMAVTFADDGEWYPPTAEVEGGEAYLGPDGIRSWWSNLEATFEEFGATIEEIRDLGDVLLAFGRLRGQFKSGISFDVDVAWVVRYRDGLAVWGRSYFNRPEALESVGLSD
jgi:ketosteroid isomerase-like protein